MTKYDILEIFHGFYLSSEAPRSKYTVTFDSSPGQVISKYDLGAFLVECLENPDYYQKVCGMANTSWCKKECRDI